MHKQSIVVGRRRSGIIIIIIMMVIPAGLGTLQGVQEQQKLQ